MNQLGKGPDKLPSTQERYFLRISRHDLDLVEVQLAGRDVAIGRSPTCDAVLRVKGVPPIQFLVSQAGPKGWFIIDLRAAKGANSTVELSLGKRVDFAGYTFEVVKRSLQASEYQQGVMEKSLKSAEESEDNSKKNLEYLTDKWLLEILELRGDSRVPEEIIHLDPNMKALREGGVYPMFGVPMKLHISSGNGAGLRCAVDCTQLPSVQIWKQGQLSTDAVIDMNQILRIDWMSRSYYVRFVNELAIPPLKRGWDGDRFISQLLGWVFLPLVVALLMWVSVSEPEVPKPKEPERIARVEVSPVALEPVPEVQEFADTSSTEVGGAPVGPRKEVGMGGPQTPSPRKNPTPFGNRALPKGTGVPTTTGSSGTPNPAPAPKAEESGLLGLIGSGKAGGGRGASESSMGNMAQNERARVKVVGQSGQGGGVGGGVGGGTGTTSGAGVGGGLSSARRGVGGPGGADVAGVTGGVANGVVGGLGLGSGLGSGRGGGGQGGFGGSEGASIGGAGGLDKNAVQRVVRENSGRLRLCYEQALVSNPSLRGKISYNWLIRPDGGVQRVSVGGSELAAPSFESCLSQVIQQMRFPKAPNGRPTQVTYPFIFQPN